jgi:ABC-type glycerol-3-phosphate transport system substrate-binding protein
VEKKKISRRDFIKAAGITAGAGLLAACAPQVVTQVVNQTQVVTQVVPQTQIVNQTQLVPQVVTATPAPTQVPAPAVMDIWAITTVADINAPWANDPKNAEFIAEWWTGGMIRAGVLPWLAKHPGVSVKISGHNWDVALRQNEYLALAAGITPDTSYGEAYVSEFAELGVYAPVSAAAMALFPDSTYRAVLKDGKAYGLAETTGANVLFVNLDTVKKAGLDPTKLPSTWDELVTMAQAISKVNKDPKWGNNAYFTYAPAAENFGIGLRIGHWFAQNNAALGSDLGVPTLNIPGAADTWVFHNQLMNSSQVNTILNIDATGELGSAQALNNGTIALKAGWTNDATTVGSDPKKPNVVAVEFPIPTGGKKATILTGNQINSPFLHGPNPALAIDYIESTTTNADAQAFKPNGCGIWIPALKSMLDAYATFDKLGGFTSDTAKAIVRVTMKAVSNGSAGPLPGWPKNGNRVWDSWNESYGRIWHGKLAKADIQKELDALQVIVVGLLTPAA